MEVTIKSMSKAAIKRVCEEMDTEKWFKSLSLCDSGDSYDVTLNPNTMVKTYCGMEGDDQILLDLGGRKEFVADYEFFKVVIV